MVWLILGVILGGLLLTMLDVISIWVALGAMAVVTVFAAWWLDRTRPGLVAPFRDANRADLHAQNPTAYIDHPTGGGPPPGVERHGERYRPWPPGSERNDDNPLRPR